MKLIVDNTQRPAGDDRLLKKAVQAYWQAVRDSEDRGAGGKARDRPCDPEGDVRFNPEDAAIAFLAPLRTRSPRGLVQKVEILAKMVETERSAEQIAVFAASIADDALSLSRSYLSRAV